MPAVSVTIRHIDLSGPRVLFSDGSRWDLPQGPALMYLCRWSRGDAVVIEEDQKGNDMSHYIINMDAPDSPPVPAERVLGWPERKSPKRE